MKAVNTLLFCFISFVCFAFEDSNNNLLNERENLVLEYQKLVDSVFVNRNQKQLLINEKLQAIKVLDEKLIDAQYSSNKALSDSLTAVNKKSAVLMFDNERMEQRTQNDLRMILILKVAAAILIVTILILIYFLVTKSGKKTLLARLNEKLTSLEQEKDELNAEIFRLRTINSSLLKNDSHGEKEQLEVQVNQLKEQLEEARSRNKSILQKIDKLINDLSGVS